MKFKSDKHNRDVHSIAQLVEGKLIDMENFFHDYQMHQGVNISVVNDLSPQEEMEVKQLMKNIYNILEQFSEQYEIKPITLSLKKEIGFKAAMLWQEIAGSNLRGTGTLDPELKEEFQQYITRLTEMVNMLYLTCKQD